MCVTNKQTFAKNLLMKLVIQWSKKAVFNHTTFSFLSWLVNFIITIKKRDQQNHKPAEINFEMSTQVTGASFFQLRFVTLTVCSATLKVNYTNGVWDRSGRALMVTTNPISWMGSFMARPKSIRIVTTQMISWNWKLVQINLKFIVVSLMTL